MLGRFGVGAKAVTTLYTGTGKTVSYAAVAIEAVRQGRRLQIVVENNRAVAEFKAELDAIYGELAVPAGNVAPPGILRFAPESYVPRKVRARLSPAAEYRALCRSAAESEELGRDQRRREVVGERRVRSTAAHRAVIIRSGGRCESPECLLRELSYPYRTRAGEPLLDVDHIDDHARGGRDHPQTMIALCPTCHRNKTHGADGAELTERLREVALRLHTEWVQASDSRSGVSTG
jgi:5-methylcytosine-specific restriction endonuclease McrA